MITWPFHCIEAIYLLSCPLDKIVYIFIKINPITKMRQALVAIKHAQVEIWLLIISENVILSLPQCVALPCWSQSYSIKFIDVTKLTFIMKSSLFYYILILIFYTEKLEQLTFSSHRWCIDTNINLISISFLKIGEIIGREEKVKSSSISFLYFFFFIFLSLKV